MNVVVTGCAGRLGRVVCEQAVARGHRVVGVDTRPPESPDFEFVVDSLSQRFAMYRVFDRLGEVEAVIHLANIPDSHNHDPDYVLQENLTINTYVLTAAAERGVRRVVFSSSVQAWGTGPSYGRGGSFVSAEIGRLPIDERTKAQPVNTYGLSKLLTEQMLDHMCRLKPSMSAASLRFPWILSMKGFEKWAPKWFQWNGDGPPDEIGDALAYVSQEDAAELCLLAAEADVPGHEVYWAVADEPRTFFHTIDDLLDAAGVDVSGRDAARELGSIFDSRKAREAFGWSPRRLFADFKRERAQQEASA